MTVSLEPSSSAAVPFPIQTKHTSKPICGIDTEIVCTRYAGGKAMVVVSQSGVIGGTMVIASVEGDGRDGKERQVAVKTLLGARNDPLVHVWASHLVACLGSVDVRELVLSIALKRAFGGAGDGCDSEDVEAEDGTTLREVAETVVSLLSS
ncbi:hypothetical protein BC830DRAFT_1121822 [Chytriomyces sp. MP71]|nr:hypothetical protein BC830DRAFT_1121822 [Chytriomyces sp. MP71]